MMDWMEIEAVTYIEADHPKALLGVHKAGLYSLVQAFFPGAKKVILNMERSRNPVEMEIADEAGFFAALVRKTTPFKYNFEVEYEDGRTVTVIDPYSFENIITRAEIRKIETGRDFKIYNNLGAHPMEIDGVSGVHFALYAPGAIRVSVVGTFNEWDGRCHQMENLYNSGIFEIFVPGAKEGDLYKFEIKTHDGRIINKSDPLAFSTELRPNEASVVAELSTIKWKDSKFISERRNDAADDEAQLILQLFPGSFNEIGKNGEIKFINYKNLAKKIVDYAKEGGYDTVELLPVCEHPVDASLGFQTLGFFAPTSRYGSFRDFAAMVDKLHENGIKLILDMSVASFPTDEYGLIGFDGTALYEHPDARRCLRGDGTLNFDFEKTYVRNFLLSAVSFWADIYHVDGIRLNDISGILYHNFGKLDSEWLPNIYGGPENLEGIGFIRDITGVMKKNYPAVLMIAEENTSWSGVTEDLKENDNALGFDYKWNNGWVDEYFDYMSLDPIYRTDRYSGFCDSMVYNYAEKYLLPISHREFTDGRPSFYNRMDGDDEGRQANIKAAFGYFFTHPGKKLMFLGQDFGTDKVFSFDAILDLEEEKAEFKEQVKLCFDDLVKLYRSEKALHELDYVSDGFEWVNCLYPKENILIFLRKSKKADETLMVILNYENIPRKNFRVGVPFEGKYKEIFNSDSDKYGGFDFTNDKLMVSEEIPWDGRKRSIKIKVPPLAISIFSCKPAKIKKADNK